VTDHTPQCDEVHVRVGAQTLPQTALSLMALHILVSDSLIDSGTVENLC